MSCTCFTRQGSILKEHKTALNLDRFSPRCRLYIEALQRADPVLLSFFTCRMMSFLKKYEEAEIENWLQPFFRLPVCDPAVFELYLAESLDILSLGLPVGDLVRWIDQVVDHIGQDRYLLMKTLRITSYLHQTGRSAMCGTLLSIYSDFACSDAELGEGFMESLLFLPCPLPEKAVNAWGSAFLKQFQALKGRKNSSLRLDHFYRMLPDFLGFSYVTLEREGEGAVGEITEIIDLLLSVEHSLASALLKKLSNGGAVFPMSTMKQWCAFHVEKSAAFPNWGSSSWSRPRRCGSMRHPRPLWQCFLRS